MITVQYKEKYTEFYHEYTKESADKLRRRIEKNTRND